MKKSKADYKAAMEYVLNACDKQEKITGAYLNKTFGVSLHFIPAMINAGYIVKGQSRRYRWKVQLGVLPIMVKRIQEDITDWNMRNINKSKSKSAVVPVEPEITPVEKTVFRVEPSTYKTVVDSKEPVAKAKAPTKAEIDSALEIFSERKFIEQNIPNAENRKPRNVETVDMQNEKIAKLEKNITLIKACFEDQTVFNEAIIDELKSSNKERKFSVRMFGLPIFSIARS
jgi:hypothetical protein